MTKIITHCVVILMCFMLSDGFKCVKSSQAVHYMPNDGNSEISDAAKEYHRRREELLNAEINSGFGFDIHLTEIEKEANDIIMRYKMKELEDGFKNPCIFNPSRHHFQVLNDIKKSELFKIIQKMPKGGILHSHMSALVSTDFIVELTKWEHLWQLTSPKGQIKKFRFARQQPQEPEQNDSPGQEKSTWRLVRDVRAEMGSDNYDKTVRPLFTLYDKDVPEKNVHVDLYEVWQHFSQAMKIVRPMLHYREAFKAYFAQVLKELADDNVQYLEMRNGTPQLHDLDGNLYDVKEIIEIQLLTSRNFTRENPSFIGSRVIYASHNTVDQPTFGAKIETVKKLHEEFPDFVIGLDLVGPEDCGNRLAFYADKLLALPKNIHLFSHSGETNWFGITDENLIDAVLLGTHRIGHAFALVKHPKVMEIVKARKIPIEINPISNQVLALLRDQRNHPASVLMAQNFPIVISSDDPSYWEATPLSNDFYIAFLGIASSHSDLRVLKKFAMNSIEYSAMSAEQKIDAFGKWQSEWDKFINDLVTNQTSSQRNLS
ncbi:Adenosine deaminase 2 [Pseudolycoriella hygida]|uniref:Adenosine deaminase n=1 Tax=Pseudolycoriella hygida TaxID=35572 RepID=A0A9Q0NC73_9DIPT|nr:Adenosine deaminase 2 [Pseudolycoriella hygida]